MAILAVMAIHLKRFASCNHYLYVAILILILQQWQVVALPDLPCVVKRHLADQATPGQEVTGVSCWMSGWNV